MILEGRTSPTFNEDASVVGVRFQLLQVLRQRPVIPLQHSVGARAAASLRLALVSLPDSKSQVKLSSTSTAKTHNPSNHASIIADIESLAMANQFVRMVRKQVAGARRIIRQRREIAVT